MRINWNNLRTWNGSQHFAFEELCCQLAEYEQAQPETRFIRKGTPDGGVECYRIFHTGDEWGWQAKFFLGPPGKGEWKQLDDSVRRALDTHPRLTRYFVCLPIDRADPRVPGQRSFMDKWNGGVKKWDLWACEKQMSVEFEYWGEYELCERLSRDEHQGRHFFWFHRELLSRRWFEERIAEAIENAGPRYTPELNVDLPIAGTFEGLGRTEQFFADMKALRGNLAREYAKLRRGAPADVGKEAFNSLFETVGRLLPILARAEEGGTQPLNLEAIISGVSEAENRLGDCRRLLWEAQEISRKSGSTNQAGNQDAECKTEPSKDLGFVLHHLYELGSVLRELNVFFGGAAARLANVSALLLEGNAGTGKTHLFCDVAKHRAAAGLPTVLLLGEHFSPSEPWSQIARILDLECGRDELLGALEAAAQACSGRALILIDGLNEGEGKNTWRAYLSGILVAVRRFPRIGIALSVRTSYTDLVIPGGLGEDKLVRRTHHGFADHEYEATKTFFEHFGIERPAVPLLFPEFQNPMFLKLFCRGLRNRGLTRMPTGLRGVTSIFEFFLDSVNDRLALPELLDYDKNERLVQKAVGKFSEFLADRGATWLARHEAQNLLNALLPREGYEKSLFRHLLSEGVFSADRFWSGRGNEYEEGIRFSYERLTDYSKAKLLLDRHLDTGNPEKSFLPDEPLGRLATDERAVWMNSGIVEALCVQVPERIGRELPEVAPYCANFDRVRRAFVLSLIIRDPKAISNGTLDYVNNYVNHYQGTHDEFLDALLTIASIPDHPYNADFLHRHLMRFTLANRDAWWSIYLHKQYGQQGAVDRLVEWAWSKEDKSHIGDESVRLLAVALAWFLTTSNRYLRDRATKALVSLLTPRLGVLRQLLSMFRMVDDPYVLERLCAVAYGCAMRSEDKASIALLAKDIFGWFFKSGSPPPDILLRDYARGVIETGLAFGKDIEINTTLARPPYRSKWPKSIPTKGELENYGRWTEGMSDAERTRLWIYDSVMGSGDFARYIIGTNSWTFEWLSRRLGSRRKPSSKEKFEGFIKSLSPKQKKLWRSYSAARNKALLFQLTLNFGIGGGEETVTEGETEEQLQSAVLAGEITFRRSLSGTQKGKYSKYVKGHLDRSGSHEEEERFDLSIAQRWIFQRVLDLGWDPELFGPFDYEVERYSNRGREATKPERIGKKYQWIAYHEFLARVADNFEFRPDSWSEKAVPYEGPWQAHIRDIDPSCLIAKTKREDWQPHSNTWWFPSSYDAWDIEPDDTNWIISSKDLPAVKPLLEVERPKDHSKWLVMEASYRWEEPTPPEQERFEVPRRNIWYLVKSYVVKKGDAQKVYKWAAKQNFMGRWMPESQELYRVFLGEFHWARAYKYFDAPHQGQSGWTRGRRDTIPAMILPTTDLYMREGSDYDCSVNQTINIYLPCGFLADAMNLRWRGVEGHYFDAHRELVAFDPSVEQAGPGALLINKDRLLDFLSSSGYAIFWTLLGEKYVLGGRVDPKEWKGRTTVNGAFRISNGSIQGTAKTSFEGPR